MRRMIAIAIMTCFLLSAVPAISQSDSFVEIYDEVLIDDKIIDESELTLPQLEALNSVGMGRGSNTNWSAAGGSQNNDEIYEMIFDSQGNVIVCGTIYQASYFGSIEVFTEGEGDILIAKLSTTGTWEWAVSAGTALYYDECRGVTIDSNDNVYGTGYFQGTVTFGNTTVETTGFDGWIARVNSTGNFDWAMKFGGFDVDIGWDIAADNYDNLYVTGYYRNETEFGGTVLSSGSNEDSRFFIAYFNTSSELWDWADDTSGSGSSIPYQVVIDPVTNDAYIAGYNTGDETWGNNSFTSSPQSTYAGFVVKYSDDGTFLWGQNTGGNQCFGTCGVYFNNIILHPDGGVVVGGNFLNTYKKQGGAIVSGQGDWDVLLVRYDSSGLQLWTYHAGGINDDRLQALSVNGKGQVQFGGTHLNDMKFDSTTLVKNTTNNKYDAFIAQVDYDSDFQWAISFGGADNDTTGALLSMPDGSIVSGGDFSGTVWFGSTPRTATDQDIFVWKFEHDKDDDGITDYIDNCLNTPNSNQSNFDSDVKGDACDSDDDNDGLHDVLDDCRYGVTEWNQSNLTLDHDADGCKDIEEDNDDDNDGIFDIDDNCPSGILDWVVDSTSDLDGDGCRDLDEDNDDDGDSILDVDDNCQYDENLNQDDYDDNGVGDLCDADDDGDGIDDLVDDCVQGSLNWTSAVQTDKDNDGCEDEGSNEDPDDDNDGILDDLDQCPRGEVGWKSSQSNDRDGDGCRNDNEDNDNDNDTVINEVDLCSNGITNWRKNTTNDNDGDGCLDDREDTDDDNDGFSDLVDFCPLQEGTASQGGMKGCPDFDSDGWADSADAFFQDETQWNDGDGDGFGDNPSGNTPDACPFFFGNSSIDRIGCTDTDGDGYSDPELSWTTGQGADAFIDEPSQWSDADSDGYGDNFDGDMVDFCTNKEGSSTIDRYGCPDIDGDGYSDPDAFWGIDKWGALGFGPDMFSLDQTQWYDSDRDGFGDNWGNPEWNDSREVDWPGVFVDNATSADMCPLVAPDGSFDDEIYYPGCLLTEPSDGGESNNDETVASDSEGMSTTTIIGIIGGIVVIGLISVIIMMVNKKPAPKKKRTVPDKLNETPAPSEASSETQSSENDTIDSWEDLPAGDYLDPDENGTVWFKANDGDNWYQNGDGTWTKWQD